MDIFADRFHEHSHTHTNTQAHIHTDTGVWMAHKNHIEMMMAAKFLISIYKPNIK